LTARAVLRHGDFANGEIGRYDAVLSNPPYIRHGDVMALTREVARYEPTSALDGGEDGLEAYRALAPRLTRTLEPEGAAFLEVGAGQAAGVQEILAASGLKVDRIAPDLAGIARCVIARLR
jgi:release factor glutamine methyltransferase